MAQIAVDTQHAESSVSTTTPLALGTFGFTTAILGSIFAGFIIPSTGAGMSILAAVAFFGGLVLLCTGMWELRQENLLSGTLFSSYGGFLMTFGVIIAPSFGILNALGSDPHPALGVFFLAWTVFAAIHLLSSLRMAPGFVISLVLLFLSYLLLTIGELTGGGTTFLTIGGWLAILTGLVAWYGAFAGLLGAGKGFFHLPM